MVSFGHLKFINFGVQIGDAMISKVAVFNTNKLSEEDAVRCLASDSQHPYLTVIAGDVFDHIFLDDGHAIYDEPVPEAVEITESSCTSNDADEN